ncbi:MAG: carboxy terminal-processing peptidase [Planctomycetia bacterium]|nr:carboxy terminal-processing peptidase [Planctomycetia bacterium]
MKKEYWLEKFRCLTIFLVLILLTTACQMASSDGATSELAPQVRDKKISESFCRLLELRHLSQKKINQQISEKGFDKYLETVDPLKIYFTKADVEEFSALYRHKMAEMAKKGDLSAAFAIYNRYLKRVDERCALAQQILDSPFDFTVDEEIVLDKDDLDYPQDDAEIYDRWRKRIKLEILSLEATDKDKEKEKLEAQNNPESAPKKTFDPYENEDPIAKLHRRYNSLQKRMHQMTNDDVLEDYLSAIANVYDPHSLYWSPKSWENFMIQMQLSLEGIGATLQSVDGYTVVKQLVKGGAAEKQGELQAEDRIISVGQGEDGPLEDVVDMKIDDVVQKIRGKQGTLVRLEVLPGDGSAKKIIKIVREKVELQDSAAQAKIFESGKPTIAEQSATESDGSHNETASAAPSVFETSIKADGTPYKIGIIDLPSFYLDMKALAVGKEGRSTVRDVKKILDDFNAENVDACVLDLRMNGGGSLPEAVALTGLFIKTGSVVQVKPSELGPQSAKSLDDPDSGIAWTKPLIVLTSKFSASASEIFAGAIKDYKRGLVVGDSTTHGKGSVQSTTELADFLFSPLFSEKANYGTLKVTIQGFYHPGGESPQLQGVKSDIVLPSLTDHLEDISESDLDNALVFAKIAAAKYPIFDFVNPNIISLLNDKSQKRVADSAEFQKIQEKINWFEESKSKKTTSLNREKYFAEREKLNTEKEELKQFEKMMNVDTQIELDYYLSEIMNITIDYLNALATSHKTASIN